MAEIIFPTVTANAQVTATASASVDPVYFIAGWETAAISAEAAATTLPAYYIAGWETAAISGDAAASWRRWLELDGTAQITASPVYANRQTKGTVLSLTLQPGESVVIDTERYTVTKGTANAIGAHTGDWIELNAETEAIDVRANASTVSAEIEYSPRYL